MTTHLISLEIDYQTSPAEASQTVEAELQKQGKPLRWAITQVEAGKMQVEAVVTTESKPVAIP